MIRWYEKYKEIAQKEFDSPYVLYKLDEFYDIVYAFFQNCYHLKDWIKNDDNIQISNDFIEDYINNNECLSICADICNGSKHLILNKSRSELKPNAGKYLIVTRPRTGESHWSTKIFFIVKTISKSLDAFELATECVRKWKHFIEVYIYKKEITPVV